ncbi:response regulator [Sphingomonas sp. 28-63-12]|uniref:response regulator n=1 Tax=Sphingomonas sp. 28-63-12 TaxID=1970434 RepID=UPI000BD2C294|nr:MAG: hybrid sensor histidine kinase/response regulator [Sphingomonas sp. 28-63-12]
MATVDLTRAFFDGSYAPHGYCLLWQPGLIWAHVVADALIALAYFSIPVALVTLIRQRNDVRYSWIVGLFAAFILACGCTHLMSIWTLWHGNYGAEAAIKVVTAIISVATAIALWPLIPRAVAVPSTATLAAANADLARAIRARDAAIAEIQAQVRHREQAEQALLQAQKLDALGQLTGGIAHDFNNLLQAIAGNIELIEKKAGAEGAIARWGRNARQAVDRGRKLTGQLLAFSRVQTMEITRFALAPVFAETRLLIDKSIGPLVRLDMPVPDPALAVVADRAQLELALLNLTINARDAMPDGGTVSIRCGPALASADRALPPGDYVMIEVRDEGMGMTPEVAARAFEPFFSTKGVGKGTGLGLSMVFGVVSQAGGLVEIDTAPGAGTTVRLILQRAAAAIETGPDNDPGSADSPASPLDGRHILVIDDDPDVLNVVADSLTALGATVRTAHDGPSGLASAIEDAYDLVIVDFAMPAMNGADVAAQLRAAHPGRPVLIATGFADSARLDVLTGDGVAIIRKPFATAALLAAIEALLGGAQ